MEMQIALSVEFSLFHKPFVGFKYRLKINFTNLETNFYTFILYSVNPSKEI